MDLTDEEINQIREIRHKRNCAIVIFTDEELDGAPVRRVEDRLIELGWDVIEDLKQ